MDFQDIQDRLVVAALPHAVFDGWTAKILVQAALDLELDPSMGERAFLAGPVAAVEHLAGLGDRLMVQDCAGADLTALRVPARLQTLIEARLRRWAPHREAVRRALALLALPGNAAVAARITWRTVDALWRAAGDASADFSWYTRRLTLAAVYSATILYWLDDASEDGADSRAFLARRLADAGRLTQARQSLSGWLAGLPRPPRRPRGTLA